jgi:hypothetical protein
VPLTYPTAPDHLAAEAGSFEPQRVSNWAVEIPLPGADKDVIIAALESFKLPKTSNEKITLAYQNGEVYVAGKAKTDEGQLIVKDIVDRDVLGALLRWRNLVYSHKTGKIGLAKDYKKTVYLVMTAPDGTYQRTAKLVGVFPPADPEFTDLTMTGNDKVTLTIGLSCDKTDWGESINGLV